MIAVAIIICALPLWGNFILRLYEFLEEKRMKASKNKKTVKAIIIE